MNFLHVDAAGLKQMLEKEDVTILDIRDPASYSAGHIENAIHIEQIEIETFVESQPKEQALVICCYHGNSSQGAAEFFSEKGFSRAYSLDGGYEHWKVC